MPVRRIKESLRGIFKTPTGLNKNTVLLQLSMVLIFIIALLLRILPYLNVGVLLKAYDPWFQFKNTNYIVKEGFDDWFRWYDEQTWYPYGFNMTKNAYPGIPWSAATLYFMMRFLGIPIDLMTLCFFFPALMGALSTIVMYFLTKELTGSKKAAVLSMFFFAIVPGYVQRTIAGFFDGESLGILLMLLTFYFFIRAYKRKSLLSSLFAGISLGYLCATWGVFRYPLDALLLFVVVLVVLRRYSSKIVIATGGTFTISLLMACMVPRIGLKALLSTEILPALILVTIIAFYESSKYIDEKMLSNLLTPDKKKVLTKLIGIGVLVATAGIITYGIIVGFPIVPTGRKFLAVLLPFVRLQDRIIMSVAENAPATWGELFLNLHVLLFIYPAGMYFAAIRLRDEDIFLILLGVLTTYFATSFVRLILLLSPVACILAAYAISEISEPFSKIIRETREKVPAVKRMRVRVTGILGAEYAATVMILIFVLGVFFAWQNTMFIAKYWSSSELLPAGQKDWQEALMWLKYNVPDDAVIASWWDYGDWISIIAGKKTVIDNTTVNKTQIAMIALAFISNETEALKIFKKYHVSYVLVFFGYLEPAIGGDDGKWPWMVKIAADVFNKSGKAIVNESAYGTIDKPGPLLFKSTIYKLLFYDEPNAQSNYYYSLMSKMSRYGYIAYNPGLWGLTSNRSLWKLAEKVFIPVFISTNRFVKIYRVDYRVLDTNESSVNISVEKICNNGTIVFKVNNTSPNKIKIKEIRLDGIICNVSLIEGNVTGEVIIDAHEARSIKAVPVSEIETPEYMLIKIETPDYPGYEITITVKLEK